MTKHNIVRILSGLTFLIFFCPFFQMCSDDDLFIKRHKEVSAIEETSDSINIEKKSPEESKDVAIQNPEEEGKRKQELTENRKKYTLNGYELAYLPFNNIDQLSFDEILDSGFLFLTLYTFIVILMLIVFISVLRKRMRAVYWLSVANLFLAILSIVLFICDPLFKEISQIKFGYYLFIINTLALIIFSRKLRSTNAA